MGEKWDFHKDFQNHIKPNDPLFLNRSNPWFTKLAENNENKKPPKPIPTTLSEEEKSRLADEYRMSIEQPATETWGTFPSDMISEVVKGKAWVVPNILTEVECEELITAGEQHGLEPPMSYKGIRTSKRTNNYSNEALSIKLKEKLSEDLLDMLEATAPYTSVQGIHPNWRVARYGEGETFPAHVDQSDYIMVQHPTKVKQRYTSSHTLLIYLRRPEQQFQGGATRLFLDGTYNGHTVDVYVPQGYGLVFEQKGLLHAGLPVKEGGGPKYIAQAGVLRGEPDGVAGQVAVFRYGPGFGF